MYFLKYIDYNNKTSSSMVYDVGAGQWFGSEIFSLGESLF